jgi:antirestriction protein ArdC
MPQTSVIKLFCLIMVYHIQCALNDRDCFMYESAKLREIQSRVLKAMAEGPQWSQPWSEAMPVNALTKKAYRGANALYLSLAGTTRPEWGTIKQWKRLGTQPMAGAKANFVLTRFPVKAHGLNEETGEHFQYTLYIERCFDVYCADQVEPTGTFFKREITDRFQYNRKVESFVKGKKVKIIHGSGNACYSLPIDTIYMPKHVDFFDTQSGQSRNHYYSTLLHELVHWTGHHSRLNRLNHHVIYSSEDEEFWEYYAFEELVAELGAVILSAHFGVSKEIRDDHINYLAIWMSRIKDDPETLFKAISLAQAAFDYLLSGKTGRKRK